MRDSINKALRWALIPALLVYVASLSLSGLAGIKGQLVLRDLAQTCGTPAGVGLLSNLGYLLWLAAAAVALFTAYSGQPGVRGEQRARGFRRLGEGRRGGGEVEARGDEARPAHEREALRRGELVRALRRARHLAREEGAEVGTDASRHVHRALHHRAALLVRALAKRREHEAAQILRRGRVG